MVELSDLELLDALGVDAKPDKKAGRTPRDERVIAGFGEIQQFVEQHGCAPAHGEDRNIFERLYAVRLERIRGSEECRTILYAFDHQGLLDTSSIPDETPIDQIEDDELLSQLGVGELPENDVTRLKHVKPRAEVRAAEEIADRTPCEDFDSFRAIFEAVQKDLVDGIRETRPFGKKETGIEHDASIAKGDLFILSGQVVYVVHVGEPIKAPNGEQDARLRVIYSNGTESDILRRSLQRALYKDEAGRRITDFGGPLFSSVSDDEDLASGTIYVLKSKSSDPVVSQHRTILHKIGVTGGDVGRRIANAAQDPTFLMADVEVVATYELYNINRTKLEKLLHRFFAGARLDLEISDRFGHPIKPQEWFFVPVPAIDDAVDKIRNGTIGEYKFDPSTAQLEPR